MKRYFYAIPFVALIDPLVSFFLASWVFGKNFHSMEIKSIIFCLFSVAVALWLICCAVWLMANKPVKTPRVFVSTGALIGLFYFAIGIYSLAIQPIAMTSDFYTQPSMQDPDFFIRLLKSSAIQIWSISLSALFMLFLFFVKIR